jgi:hypothetical protein
MSPSTPVIDDDLKHATVLTALNDMVRRGHFNVCTLDRCADILGLQLKGSEPYKLLGALHCVDFASMPPDVRKAVPEWIRQCLNLEPLAMVEIAQRNSPHPFNEHSSTPRRTLLDRLLN